MFDLHSRRRLADPRPTLAPLLFPFVRLGGLYELQCLRTMNAVDRIDQPAFRRDVSRDVDESPIVVGIDGIHRWW